MKIKPEKAYYWLRKGADAGQMNAKIERSVNYSATETTTVTR
jgi:TPR repeat protein